MPLSAATIPSQKPQSGRSIRDLLREETRDAHDAIDARYGALDLASIEDYRTFLGAQLLAWTALDRPWSRQLHRIAGRQAPDYAALLRADLAELAGSDPLPADLAPPAVMSDAGVAYVLAGSRIGMVTIRRRPNWGAHHGYAQRFLVEPSGGHLFRLIVADLEREHGRAVDRTSLVASARLAFGVFHTALDAVGGSRR